MTTKAEILSIIIFLALLQALTIDLSAKPKRVADKQKGEVRTAEQIRDERELRYFFYEAMLAMDENKYDEAMALLQHCHLISPDDAATNYYLGILYGGLHDDERMLQYIDLAYAASPHDYWYPYSVQHYKTGEKSDRKKAIIALQKEIRRSPDDSHAAEVLQNIYIRETNTKSALRMQDLIEHVNGTDMYSALQRYRLYMMSGKSKQAAAVINKYLQQDPDNYYMQVFLGDVMMQQGEKEAAYKQYVSVEKSYPENPYLALSLSNYYGETGDYTRAAQYELQAISNDIISLDYKLDILRNDRWLRQNDSLHLQALQSLIVQYPLEEEAHRPLADYYLATERNEEAESILWTILDINPAHTQTWQTLLSLYQKDSTATTDEYLHLTRKALEHQPQEQQWYFIMSSLKMQQEQADSAIYFCKQGLSQPDATDLHYKIALYVQLADIYVQQSQLDSAFYYYEAALSYNPENIYVLNNYAYILAVNGGDLRKAEKMSQRTIKAEPDNATYLDTYAWILHLSGQETLAKFYMQQAWANAEDKTDPELREHYKVIIESTEQPNKAEDTK